MRVFAGAPGEPLEEVFPPEREAAQEEWVQVFGPSPTEPSEEARACAQARLDASLRALPGTPHPEPTQEAVGVLPRAEVGRGARLKVAGGRDRAGTGP